MPPPDWTLSSQKTFPKADHSITIEERLAILETAALEILSSCDNCQQGLWQATQCSELSHRILVIALSQAYPVIPLNKSFVETAKRKTARIKHEPLSPRWITQYRQIWELDWNAANALVEKGLTPRAVYSTTAEILMHMHHIKPDIVLRIITMRDSHRDPDPLVEGRLRFADRRSLVLGAVTIRELGIEMPIEVTFEEQSSVVAPAYVREPLKHRFAARGILFTEEVPPESPVAAIGT